MLSMGTGVLDGVDGAYAAHIWSEVDAGTVSCEPGPRMANTDWFRIDQLTPLNRSFDLRIQPHGVLPG